MPRPVIVILCAVSLLLLMPLAASAQRPDLQMFPSDGLLHDRAARPGSLARDLYPHRPPVSDAPGFVAPLTKSTETGRAGIAGWTAPNVPVGSRAGADPDSAGWFGFGFAAEWGGPLGRARN